jgi:carboxyl-terminal processing protease
MGWGSRRTFLTQTGAGLALSGCLSAVARDHLAVFDAMWRTVDEWYFDPAMGGIDWKAVCREWRPKAARAETPAALYLEVLIPVLDQFQTSHVDLRPPDGNLTLPVGRMFPLPRQKRGAPIFMITPEDEAGMGAVLTGTGSAYIVDDVVHGGPAQMAGLWPGQLVQLGGWSLPKGRRQLRLFDGNGSRFTVAWTPKLALPRRAGRLLDHDTAYLRFDEFDQPSVTWAIDTLSASASRSAVLDLRRNGGGLIVEAGRLNSALLPESSSLGLFRSRKRDYRPATGPMPTRFAGPLAVLIGPRTASAAEVTAAALQHHERARLFGTPSLGSVLAARIYDLPDGGKLTIPYADYLTPSGIRIEDRGVTPDVFAPRTADSMREGRDPALDAALDWLRRGQ